MLLRLDGVTVKEVSQANQSMRGDLSDTQNSIGLRHSVSIAIIVQNSSD